VADKRVDTLLTSLGGRSVHQVDTEAYRAYRRAWEEYPRTGFVAPFPLDLDVEVTARCNLRCRFCRTTYQGSRYPKDLLDEALFARVIDEGAALGLRAVKFNWRGEPLLHPSLERMVAHAKDRGLLDVFFNTNAQLLTEARAAELVRAGLDRVTISAEGCSPEVYEANRVGGSFDTLVRNVEGLRNARDRLGSAKPRIRIQTVKIPELRGREEAYTEFWSPLADEVACLRLKEEVDYERNKGRVSPTWVCPQLWQRMVVACDGTVVPCNEDDLCRLALGRAGADRLQDLWRGPRLESLRRLHRAGCSHEEWSCNRCPLRASDLAEEQAS